MPIPKYYVRPDGLHESIITVNGKRDKYAKNMTPFTYSEREQEAIAE